MQVCHWVVSSLVGLLIEVQGFLRCRGVCILFDNLHIQSNVIFAGESVGLNLSDLRLPVQEQVGEINI